MTKMHTISPTKKKALIEASKKAGVKVDQRRTSTSFTEIVFRDESGQKYKLGEDFKFTPLPGEIGSAEPIDSKQAAVPGRYIICGSKRNVLFATHPQVTCKKLGKRKSVKHQRKFGKIMPRKENSQA